MVTVMKGDRYYKNLDFSKPVATLRYVDNIKSRRALAKVALVAMARICQSPCGTITDPSELASSRIRQGDSERTLIQCIYEDGYVQYNDGWFIVECDEDGTLYVDVTGAALRECSDVYSDMKYVGDKDLTNYNED